MNKAPTSANPASESGKRSEGQVSKRSSANQAKRRSSVNQASKRSSINQASNRSSVNKASKRSSVNAAKGSSISGIAEAAGDEGDAVPAHNVNRVPVFSTDPRSGILPAHFPNKEWGSAHRILREKEVDEFLAVHPQVLLDFIYDTVELDSLEELLRQKKGVIEDEDESQTERSSPQTRKPSGLFDQKSTCHVGRGLITAIQRDESLHGILEDYCHIFSRIVHADSHKLYVQDGLDSKVYFLLENGHLEPCVLKGTVAGRALKKKTSVLITDMSTDPRFKKRTDCREGLPENSSVLCVPMILPTKEIPAIVEVIRKHCNPPFIETDVQIANISIGWIAACVGEHIGKRSLISQQHLIDFLLENTKELFDGVTQTEELVPKIMRHTKDLVKADRCSLFLVDDEKEELYANYFDEGAKSGIGVPVFEKKEMIRFPKGIGIAGHVAETAEVMNIHDAYEDPRFNKEVDMLTGYRTRSILCMPIINRNCVKGVIQMVNSTRSEHFTASDESALRMFTAYCAIALHYNNFYSTLDRQKVKNKACIEVIQYHTICQKSSYVDLLNDPLIRRSEIPKCYFSFDFYAPANLEILPKLFINIVEDLSGKNRFESEKLVKFILTVKKNYRNVPYHNFPHGFHVAHCLWRIILTAPDAFTEFQKMGLVVAGICHDVDHRGYNNEFFKKLQLPLANLYSTSVMEQHHYRQTVTILQTEDIFSFLSPQKYKQMLCLIRQCILATDLALYFGNQKTLQKLLDENRFDIKDEQCTNLTMELMMTAGDLSGIAKPWKTNKSSTNQLYEEFYEQGDEERKRGFVPRSMMDRAYSDDIPKQQVEFIDFICVPLYRTVVRIFPGAKHLLCGCLRNRRKWQKIVGIQSASQMNQLGAQHSEYEDLDDDDEEEDVWVNVFNVKETSCNQSIVISDH
ncbi:cAMP and cAMP-inhibited cGMP 3',5'-cyclic phosphodiesterase 10A-like [Mizuhopecten yessoensis]|uniref:Phosphodiesterase n=1 Tax=Mizuhopecten yessoensis TaxID=6573 RepID=A0A210PI82_MIZYE|nr:cAMP and cAMP-inhibited cGMP 3',5'-cyclic phosphodiesterase 10A-like [Mizuhopecten yessoensis]XP_021341046.1 cAMP and cAMP-inhibited cGMP 3',5'-cyclic phosphodiesterase 10A-like [Mizuhopecten yessoensis]XP_021341047.1 cAMP and cAMP-inhibited cGMP 3',5'-cyclic phosphodiesterase 10A-like [Mizuhopecten yessoensis]OWF36192.1 cAMP and cAMP-inhibited cGMP 3',5'-cyclic phosphodiesterase 10A [Mizuhopecten yessoensis]